MQKLFIAFLVLFSLKIFSQELEVKKIKAWHKNGQTFITWKDVAEGESAADYTYNVYRSTTAITNDNKGKPYMTGILSNSGILFGHAFNRKQRFDENAPMTIFELNGEPLPKWSGLAVVTTETPGNYFYAVEAVDAKNNIATKITEGNSSLKEPIAEEVQPIQPIKIYDSKTRKGPSIKQTEISGTEGLPLLFVLHASNAQGGGAGEYGDYYLYFSRPEWGYRDGLPGVFSISETHLPKNNHLRVTNRDAIQHPNGRQGVETFWFGYACIPQWATHTEPRAYPFTEKRLLWILEYCIKTYKVDKNRIYGEGGSMGAWGSTSFSFHQKNIFAAVYPNRPRTKQKGLPSLAPLKKNAKILMDDGEIDYFNRMDTVEFALNDKSDLPFYGWCCGRRDGFATWQEQIDMVNAMKKSHHGFAFAWNDGDHSSGTKGMIEVQKWYPKERFALNLSYPAFANSSIDQNMGNGDPKDGDEAGGINLGFKWTDPEETETKWTIEISNELCQDSMIVDISPRRCQTFKRLPNQEYQWTSSLGEQGTVKSDADALIIIEKLKIEKGKPTILSIEKR